jgi:hypothetical protein
MDKFFCEKSINEMLAMVEFLNDHYETVNRLMRQNNGSLDLVNTINTQLEILVKQVHEEIVQTYERIMDSRKTSEDGVNKPSKA